ncbi:MAG: hypothetical protein QM642_09890, partial [Edaphocola sp.]
KCTNRQTGALLFIFLNRLLHLAIFRESNVVGSKIHKQRIEQNRHSTPQFPKQRALHTVCPKSKNHGKDTNQSDKIADMPLPN